MEPVCFNTGNCLQFRRPPRCGSQASMEPVCFNTGNSSGASPGLLMMSRFNGAGVFQHRKRYKGRFLNEGNHCFNGAGVFQHRKHEPRSQCVLPLASGFNGAGVFQHRKPGVATALRADGIASMEPVCFNTGNW